MPKEILISDDEYETRCAIIEDGDLSEIYVERKDDEDTLGNIYKGRVENVLPGMQSAFVEIGLEKHAFLHISDINYDFDDIEEETDKDLTKLDLGSEKPTSRKGSKGFPYSINELVHKNQEILVQVVKESLGTKGPRVTSCISLPGRYVVYLPTSSNIGVSRRIESAEERQRLRDISQKLRSGVEGGFIVRTAAEGKSEEAFSTEIKYLVDLWKEIRERGEKMPVRSLVREDLGFIGRIIRDYFTNDVTKLVFDSKERYKETIEYLSSGLPELSSRVKLHEKSSLLFEAYGIEKELKKAVSEKRWLKCGGHIVIQQTEAMVSIDVNTGRFVGKADPDNTILSANLEAVEEIVRQMRLRDLGGIIVVDFIDMDKHEHRKMLFKALQEALKKDRSRTNILHVSEIGLVEMTRQRTRPSLSSLLTESCPYCDGHGRILSVDTITISVLRSIKKAHLKTRKNRLRVIANELIVTRLLDEDSNKLSQLEKSMNLKIKIDEDADLHLEDYQILAEDTNREIYLD